MTQQIEHLSLSTLTAYERNSRTHSEAQIVASIREFGFTNPVLIDDNNRVIAGHGRLQAATMMSMDTVPCLRLTGLTDDQLRAYVIADNKLAENAGWDKAMLNLEIEELKLAGFDLDLLGFEQIEIDSMLMEKKEKLKDVGLKAPKMSWVLVGIPLVNYADIAAQIEEISANDMTIVQTTVTN